MSPTSVDLEDNILTKPRPGHADLSGLLKFGVRDFRDILERSSARETAGRVAAGAVCKELLRQFNIDISSYVIQIGKVKADMASVPRELVWHNTEMSFVRCPDLKATKAMILAIRKAASKGDTLGGKFVVRAKGVPPGLGSHVQWDLKLDGRLAQSLMSIQAVKSVEFGRGVDFANLKGSESFDEIFYDKRQGGFYRKTNRSGGIEGGMSNGKSIEVRCTMKAIPSLGNPLKSVDVTSKKPVKAETVRSDICAVPAAGVVAEAAVAIEIARAMSEKFGGDSLEDMKKAYDAYMQRILEA
jgi:chorismate synthase